MTRIKEKEHKQSEWHYDRTNSKGEVKLRRNTNEELVDVMKYLDDNHITYAYRENAYMFWIYEDQTYQYFYTTGKWGVPRYGNKFPSKHYHSRDIKDFITRFVNKEKTNER
jgi:hypothetical protein